MQNVLEKHVFFAANLLQIEFVRRFPEPFRSAELLGWKAI